MDKYCPSLGQIERFFEGAFKSGEERRQWESHLEIGDECRDALDGHQVLLKSLAGDFPIPRLSPQFERELKATLSRDKAPATSTRRRRLLLQGYWLLALGASLVDSGFCGRKCSNTRRVLCCIDRIHDPSPDCCRVCVEAGSPGSYRPCPFRDGRSRVPRESNWLRGLLRVTGVSQRG